MRIIIKNIGDQIAKNIEWTLNSSGGIIVFGDGIRGSRPPTSMDPKDEKIVTLVPAPLLFPNADGQSPIGLGPINMKATVKGSVGSTIQSASATSDAFLLGPFILMR
jgi:hypothetical protein